MPEVAKVAHSPLFEGLSTADLQIVAQRALARTFRPGEPLCLQDQPSERCWIITSGLVDVVRTDPSGATTVLARQRKGASVGEVGVILDEPQPETVVASTETTALGVAGGDLRALVERCPQILTNVVRAQQRRMTQARRRDQGETVAMVLGGSVRHLAEPILAAARRASPRPVTTLDRDLSFAGAVITAEDLATTHDIVVLQSELEVQTASVLLREADRMVAVAGTAEEAAELGRLSAVPEAEGQGEVVLIGAEAIAAGEAIGTGSRLRLIRACETDRDGRLSEGDLGWLGRHITGTKLGVALGAGGAKGYAHVGVLEVLEEAGYVVDYVAGSSIGRHRRHLSRARSRCRARSTGCCGRIQSAYGGRNLQDLACGHRWRTGSDEGRAAAETTGGKTFADTRIPLTIMTVDLSERAAGAAARGAFVAGASGRDRARGRVPALRARRPPAR